MLKAGCFPFILSNRRHSTGALKMKEMCLRFNALSDRSRIKYMPHIYIATGNMWALITGLTTTIVAQSSLRGINLQPAKNPPPCGCQIRMNMGSLICCSSMAV